MSRQEFLNILQTSLTGRVNASEIADNINYYEDYINTQTRMGRSEEEVIAELGDPRLIAKSIIEANRHADAKAGSRQNDTGEAESAYNSGYSSSAYNRRQRSTVPVWLIVLLVIVALLLVFSMIFSVFIFLAPILIPIACVCLILRLAGRRS